MSKDKYTREEKQLFQEMFWASLPLECSYNYERQQALGYAIAMWPAIKRIYQTQEERAEALTRHMAIFNTTPQLVNFITGVSTAMEYQAKEDENFDVDSINSVKVGLMGPFAGIGDSFFWGTLRIIATGVALPLAMKGNALGPLLFLLIFNIPHYLIRYFGGIWGYKLGTNILTKASDTGIMDRISKAATIVGLMVVGAMSASMVGLTMKWKFTMGDRDFLIQDFVDQIFPRLLPLLYTLLMFYFLKKGKKTTFLLLFTILFGLVLTVLGVI